MKTRLCLVVLLTAVALTANAADDSAFAKANQTYAEGRFAEAATGYETLIRSGNWNANLFYDLGNARYRLRAFRLDVFNFDPAPPLYPRPPEGDAHVRVAGAGRGGLGIWRGLVETAHRPGGRHKN